MRKFITLSMIIFFISSCASENSSEKAISKYFKAMKDQDKETMDSLTPDPKIIPFESFSITSIGVLEPEPKQVGWVIEKGKKIKPIMEIYRESFLFGYQIALDQIKKDQDELKSILKKLKMEVENLQGTIEITKDKKEKIDLEKKIEELEESISENEEKLKTINFNMLKFDKLVASELKLIKLSLGIINKIYGYQIKELKRRAGVSLILNEGDKKELGLILKRYFLEDSLDKTSETVEGKWVIESISEISSEERDSFGVFGVDGGVISGVHNNTPSEDKSAVRLTGDMESPKLIKKVDPEYPYIASAARIQGQVIIEALTDIDGKVKETRIISGHPMLRESAISAVKHWIYEPYYMNGIPKPVIFTVTVTFSLKVQ